MSIPTPDQPLRVALIGAGRRSTTQYAPLLPSLSPWLKLVAVCDPVADHAEKLFAKIEEQQDARLPSARRYQNRIKTAQEGVRVSEKAYAAVKALSE